jgi:hypothetical protein
MSTENCGEKAKNYEPDPPNDTNPSLLYLLYLPVPHLRLRHHDRAPFHRYCRLHKSVKTVPTVRAQIVTLEVLLAKEERGQTWRTGDNTAEAVAYAIVHRCKHREESISILGRWREPRTGPNDSLQPVES